MSESGMRPPARRKVSRAEGLGQAPSSKLQAPSSKLQDRSWILEFGSWNLELVFLRRQQPRPRRADFDRLAGLITSLEARLCVVRLRVAAAPLRVQGYRSVAGDLDGLAVGTRKAPIEEVIAL